MFKFGFGQDIGIDLGTATVLGYVKGKGIVLKEPCVVAVNSNTNEVLAVGSDAVNIFTSDVMVDDELVNTDLTVDPAAEGNVDANEEKDYKLDYEVYAVQSETFTGAAEAWAATFGAN